MRAVVLALLALSSCVGSYSRAVEETREGLVGLSARELRRCLGAPTSFEILDDVELQTYRFERPRDSTFSIGGANGAVLETRGRVGTGFPGSAARQPTSPGYCQLDFELREGAVASVRADGRDEQGMNVSGACMLEARRCLPDEEDDSE